MCNVCALQVQQQLTRSGQLKCGLLQLLGKTLHHHSAAFSLILSPPNYLKGWQNEKWSGGQKCWEVVCERLASQHTPCSLSRERVVWITIAEAVNDKCEELQEMVFVCPRCANTVAAMFYLWGPHQKKNRRCLLLPLSYCSQKKGGARSRRCTLTGLLPRFKYFTSRERKWHSDAPHDIQRKVKVEC